MVFVLDSNNNSLSPTTNAKARRLLSSNKAFVFRLFPFVIKLKQSFNSTKSFSIKIDPGSSISGISIVDQDKALFFFELIHRGKEIKKAIFQRRNIRKSRRNRKTRYRKCRFLNRTRKANWLAPSVKSRALLEENNLPKEHYYDALSVGEDKSYKIVTDKVLIIKAIGRGTRQMCRVDKYGFPRTTPKQNKIVKGFMSGDLVRAKVLKGKKIGKYFGKVAIRSNGYFNITTNNGVIQGIGYKDCKVIQKSDGYSYNIKGVSKFPANLKEGVSFAKI